MPWSRVLTFADPLPCQSAILTADVEILPTTISKIDFRSDDWSEIDVNLIGRFSLETVLLESVEISESSMSGLLQRLNR